MVPKPEEVYGEGTQPEPSIYSNSEGEQCAILVKAGQLDTFTSQRRFKRQEINNFVKTEYQDNSDNEYQTLNISSVPIREKRRSKSETRGRTVNRTFGQSKLSRSSSRDQIRIGDRVIIKGKYIGTCKYVGPIEEEDFSLPEIWFGVQLDEKLTNNSGIFGSREYFNCPFGFGVMVTLNKIRKIKSCSVSFKNGPTTSSLRPSKSMTNLNTISRKVSIGANSMENSWRIPKRHASKKRWELENAHPMHTLNQIKDIQRNFAFDNTDPFGLPLQGLNSSHQGYPNNDQLRRSFERIVSYNGDPFHLQRNQSLPVLPTYNNQLKPMHRSYSLNEKHMRIPQSYAPEVPTRRSSSQSLSSNSLQSTNSAFALQKRLLCPSCASCTKCTYNGSSDNAMFSDNNPMFKNNPFHQRLVPQSDDSHRRVNFANSLHSDSSSSASSSGDEAPSLTNPAMLSEYEKWKSHYGVNRGRSMKRGMSKLSSAFL